MALAPIAAQAAPIALGSDARAAAGNGRCQRPAGQQRSRVHRPDPRHPPARDRRLGQPRRAVEQPVRRFPPSGRAYKISGTAVGSAYPALPAADFLGELGAELRAVEPFQLVERERAAVETAPPSVRSAAGCSGRPAPGCSADTHRSPHCRSDSRTGSRSRPSRSAGTKPSVDQASGTRSNMPFSTSRPRRLERMLRAMPSVVWNSSKWWSR